ncbi:alpha/beta hydrolase [Alkalihalophilus pseudofirmus]|uniref:Alpha/beta hydrolase n=1 Tax=Alkalihalophilus pseudofirmus TaxID=79885 RepID=A0AAJ2NMR3_ALKPS|nr:alpha/beta hydrolase [Alkalihalophilus pseudofirmus]MDV2884810.1 alpha/beta hydrolase [Alkalihalophilus pseudofirmus]
MPKLSVNNTEIYYEVKGVGEPLVFTHGASWNHKQWKQQVDYFSERYQTIIWDVRGHGSSSLPSGKVDSEDFSKDLINLLKHLGIEKANLCGLSMGGHISLQAAIRYPSYVKSLILIGTPFTMKFNWYEKFFVPINRWSNRMIPMALSAKLQALTLSTFNRKNRKYIEETVSSMSYTNWVRIWDAVSRMDSKDKLKDITCPTLILYGDHDTMTQRQQKYMNEMIYDSRLLIIHNAHHATNMDNAEEVNFHIEQFLSECALKNDKGEPNTWSL